MPKVIKEKKPKVIKETEVLYNITLEINDKVLEASAPTIEEALLSMKEQIPQFIKTRGILKIEMDGKKAERFLSRVEIRRMFVSGLLLTVIGNRLRTALK